MTKGLTENKENPKSWAEQVEFDDGAEGTSSLPPKEETYDEDTQLKTVVEYHINDKGKKVKVIKTYRVNRVSKAVARRMALKKFGECSKEPSGPNPANTRVEEDISINYNISEVGGDEDEETRNKLKGKAVSCRFCKGDHWSTKCPYKDTLGPIQEMKKDEAEASAGAGASAAGAAPSQKYVPPNVREGGNRRGESMNSKGRDDATVRVTNLSEDTRESDLQELFKGFGSIARIFLAKDKSTGQSKGYAFVSYFQREDADKAIRGLHGYGYDHLILSVEWAKPNVK